MCSSDLRGGRADPPTPLRPGLVDGLGAAEALEDDAHRLAGVLASRSALSQRVAKEVVAALGAARDGQAEAGRWYRETIAAGELAEGVAAFAGRRPPRFPWAEE